jgi:hypothetical protein
MSFIATGLGIAGLMGVEGALAAAATVAIGEAAGAGIGALTNPKDRLKGALMGGLTGAVGGGIGAGIGALGGAASGAAEGVASGAVGNAATQTGGQAVTQAALTEAPGAITSQGIGTAAGAPGIGIPSALPAAAPVAAPVAAPAAESSLLGTAGSTLTKAAAPKLLETGLSFVGGGGQPVYDKSGQQKIGAANLEGAQMTQDVYGSLPSSWKPYGKAKGGAIHLRDGDFIIPADVVSAIGNGSTKAGAEYLDHLFNALRAGPKPKAGSLAKRRAKERRTA